MAQASCRNLSHLITIRPQLTVLNRACWLVRHLVFTYPSYNIISFDKLDYCASLNNTGCLDGKPNFTFHRGDVTNPSDVLDCMERHNIDTVMHFAAQSHVDLSFGNSYGFTHTNVYGTHVLLESAKKVGIGRFIHISTDEVYGEVSEGGDDLLETSILAPTNPYAASKAAAEMLVQSYQKSFKLPVIIARSNNVYGPHQFPESMAPISNETVHLSPANRLAQKSSQSSHAYSSEGGLLFYMVTARPLVDTSTQETQQTLSTPFFTKDSWVKSTTLGQGMRSPISNSAARSLLL